MTAAAVCAQPSQFPKVGLLLLAAALGLALIAGSVSLHAVIRHSSDAVAVNEALCRQGPNETWHHPATGRDAFIVCLPDGRWGVQIDGACGTNVTCLIKEKLTKLDHVRRWLTNGGYVPGE